MYRYYCQEHPFIYSLTAQILARDAGRIMVEHSPFFPGGGGQLADRGTIISNGKSTTVKAVEILPEGVWHTIEKSIGDCDFVEIRVDEYHRTLQCELHTLAHIVNAIVFKAFDGALLTGAQLGENGTLRIDFDLPGVDNDRLRALEEPINAAAQEVTKYQPTGCPGTKLSPSMDCFVPSLQHHREGLMAWLELSRSENSTSRHAEEHMSQQLLCVARFES